MVDFEMNDTQADENACLKQSPRGERKPHELGEQGAITTHGYFQPQQTTKHGSFFRREINPLQDTTLSSECV